MSVPKSGNPFIKKLCKATKTINKVTKTMGYFTKMTAKVTEIVDKNH